MADCVAITAIVCVLMYSYIILWANKENRKALHTLDRLITRHDSTWYGIVMVVPTLQYIRKCQFYVQLQVNLTFSIFASQNMLKKGVYQIFHVSTTYV